MYIYDMLPLSVQRIMDVQIFANTLLDVFLALCVFFLTLGIVYVFKHSVIGFLRKRAKRTPDQSDDTVVSILDGISGFFYHALAVFLTLKILNIHNGLMNTVDAVMTVIAVWESSHIIKRVIAYALSKGNHDADHTMIQGVRLIVSIVIWTLALLFVLDNLGVDITAMVASLGIGGIAIALAAQNLLGDLFASFTIYFDKPFEVGDFITLGEHNGTVKNIGLKTTRIQTLQGEELVVSNRELTETRVQNFKKLQKRRVSFTLGVVYHTPQEKLLKIPKLIQAAIEAQETVEFTRAHFKSFGDFSLNFDVVMHVLSKDYVIYMDVLERVNFAIRESFIKEGISMAFPTQTVHVHKES